ncbi:MAG: hypothetical protein J7M18_01650, partial [Candidatus Eremiobacteraeota bacterium]|nr:hypothetical protein [Candidatus Eremiobacteraeota bacterium]
KGKNEIKIDTKIFVLIVLVISIAFMVLFYLMGKEAGRKEVLRTVLEQSAQQEIEREIIRTELPEKQLPEQVDIFSSPIPPEQEFTANAWQKSARQIPVIIQSQKDISRESKQATKTMERKAVRRYFNQLDQALVIGKTWDNPQEFAQSIMGQLMKGDTSGLEDLAQTYRRAHNRVSGIIAPQPCQEHKKMVLESLGSGIQMAEGMLSAFKNGNPGSIMKLMPQASSMKAKAMEADRMAEEIKLKYGLTGANLSK